MFLENLGALKRQHYMNVSLMFPWLKLISSLFVMLLVLVSIKSFKYIYVLLIYS